MTDKNTIPSCIFLDIPKAFDSFEKNGIALSVFLSYIFIRKENVKFGHFDSDLLNITTEAP